MRITYSRSIVLATTLLAASLSATPVFAQPHPPAGDPAPGVPAAAGILRPGLHVNYYMGSASLPGVRTTLVQDDNGNWIDPGTGQHYAQADNPGSGGAGFLSLNVVAADNREIAVDARNYVLMDPAQGLAITSMISSYLGTPDGLGDFWQPPAKLANMADQNQGGLRILHMPYPLGGHTYNAVAITNTAASGFSRNVYDVDTGLLIVQSASSVGAAQVTPNPDGTTSPGAGVTTITSVRLLGVRQLNIPWGNQPSPPWARANATVDYAGTYDTRIPGVPAMAPWHIQVRFAMTDARASWMPCKQFMRLDSGMGGPPQDSDTMRALGGSLFDPLWIDPQALANVRPGTVLDEDSITKRRFTFVGPQGGVVVIMEQGPYEQSKYGYDPRSGMLVVIEHQRQQSPATIITNLQLVKQP